MSNYFLKTKQSAHINGVFSFGIAESVRSKLEAFYKSDIGCWLVEDCYTIAAMVSFVVENSHQVWTDNSKINLLEYHECRYCDLCTKCLMAISHVKSHELFRRSLGKDWKSRFNELDDVARRLRVILDKLNEMEEKRG